MTSLLPLIEPPEPQTAASGDTSRLYREIQWDDQTNRPGPGVVEIPCGLPERRLSRAGF